MKETIQFELDDGTLIYLEGEEIRNAAGSSFVRLRGGDRHSEQNTVGRFQASIERIRPAAQLVLDSFRSLNSPDEINLEFGIKFNSKVGAIIASADSEATFKVALKWKNRLD